jgi:hypothetical protein
MAENEEIRGHSEAKVCFENYGMEVFLVSGMVCMYSEQHGHTFSWLRRVVW